MTLIGLEYRSAVAILTINRPEALNALNRKLLEELNQTLDVIDLDVIRCLIITGTGEKAFVAGADIEEMKDMVVSEAVDFSEMGSEIMRKIETYPIPIIAAINGYALGGGNELAMSCDIRLASINAVFGQPEVGLGIIPGFGGTQRLVKIIGSLSKAKELLYTGSAIKAQEALTIGIVSAIYPIEDLLPEALKMANKIASRAPIAVRYTKKAIDYGLERNNAEGDEYESQLFGSLFDTKDQRTGMSAFLNKERQVGFKNA